MKVYFLSLSLFLASFLSFTQYSLAYPLNPDPQLTPGIVCDTDNEDFYEFRYQEDIPYCKRSVSTYRKKQIYKAYGIPLRCKYRFTIDHFIPLSIGGDNSNENLWPEHKDIKATRYNLENELYWGMRRGSLTQQQAIDIIVREKMKHIILLKNTKFDDDCNQPDIENQSN